MEYFVTSRLAAPGDAPRYRKDRFSDLGAAFARAVELYADYQAGEGPQPVSVTDFGERLLLGEREIARLAATAGQSLPMGDRIAREVFASLDDAALDELCGWLAFRMRTAGIPSQQRLHLVGVILDAISPDE
jgi:hypothetical protein